MEHHTHCSIGEDIYPNIIVILLFHCISFDCASKYYSTSYLLIKYKQIRCAIIFASTIKGDAMKKQYYNYVGVYVFTYGAMGMMLPLIGQYLHKIGFSGAEIGFIMATGTGVAIFASIFWGDIYNNSRNKKRVILILCLATAIISVSLAFIDIYLLFLTAFGILYFFQSPVLALQDAMTLEDDQLFGAIRKWGAIGFAGGNLIASMVVSLMGLKSIFYLYYCISCNVSTIICQLFGGIILDKYDVGAVYLFFALYNLIGVILYLLWGLHRPQNNG